MVTTSLMKILNFFEIFEILKFCENFEILNFTYFLFFYFRVLKFYEILWKLKFLKIFEILWKFWNLYENFEFFWNLWNLEIFENFRVFVDRRWSPSVPNRYKTFIQSGRETKNPRKRFTLSVDSLKNYGPLNSQTTGKGEKIAILM